MSRIVILEVSDVNAEDKLDVALMTLDKDSVHKVYSAPIGTINSRRDHKREAFLEWLLSMDDPDDHQGLEERRTVRLDEIIRRARAAR